MPSHSWGRWSVERAEALDEIGNAHLSVGGSARGRRYATQQLNHAYATLLSAQFQGFCRDLHSECAEQIISLTPSGLQQYIRSQFLWGRALARGNPNPGNIGTDFGRFGMAFWAEVRADHHLNERRQRHLEELNVWRNAIVHQDFDPARLGGTIVLHLAIVRQWRSSLYHLTVSFDRVMCSYLQALIGTAPWDPH
jgi:hypothetical protein